MKDSWGMRLMSFLQSHTMKCWEVGVREQMGLALYQRSIKALGNWMVSLLTSNLNSTALFLVK